MLNNCTLSGNSVTSPSGSGGGASYATLNNCIIYYNIAPTGGNYFSSTLNYCCTTPLPGVGTGNFTNAPLFVDQAGANLRLQTNSPCINAGNNVYVVGATDLEGNPRISGGIVDVGAYEYQFPEPFLTWLAQYGLPTDGSANYLDTDHDGHNNWQEWLAGTNPTNAASVFRLRSPAMNPAGLVLQWIYGTSYGGTAAAMCLLRHPEVFQAACSSSPVTDFRNYDTVYTERYMWIPQECKAAYDAASLLTYAGQLRGRLMLYYGSADDNVHPSNMMQFVQALQKAGKGFELQVGPDHGHSGLNQERMMEFFIENLVLK